MSACEGQTGLTSRLMKLRLLGTDRAWFIVFWRSGKFTRGRRCPVLPPVRAETCRNAFRRAKEVRGKIADLLPLLYEKVFAGWKGVVCDGGELCKYDCEILSTIARMRRSCWLKCWLFSLLSCLLSTSCSSTKTETGYPFTSGPSLTA